MIRFISESSDYQEHELFITEASLPIFYSTD